MNKRSARCLEERQRALEKPGDNLLSRMSTIIGGDCLTTEFGMGSGMASRLWSPGIRFGAHRAAHAIAGGGIAAGMLRGGAR